jgi:hypothetical protein
MHLIKMTVQQKVLDIVQKFKPITSRGYEGSFVKATELGPNLDVTEG